MGALIVNGSTISINGGAKIEVINDRFYVDGELVPAKFKKSLFSGDSITIIDNKIKVGRNKIVVSDDFVKINGMKINLPVASSTSSNSNNVNPVNTNSKKYAISTEKRDSIRTGSNTLHRIIATEDIVDNHGRVLVRKGEKGGYVSSRKNLSEDGSCWIYDNAKCYGNARVEGDAQIRDNVNIYGDCKIRDNAVLTNNAEIYGMATIKDNATVSGNASILGSVVVEDNARVSGNANIFGNSQVSDSAEVSGNAEVFGNTQVSDNAKVSGNAQVFGDAVISGNDVVSNGMFIQTGTTNTTIFSSGSITSMVKNISKIFGNGNVTMHGPTSFTFGGQTSANKPQQEEEEKEPPKQEQEDDLDPDTIRIDD